MRLIDWKTRSACVLFGLLASSGALAGGGTADLSITKTDGVTTAVPGGSVTYTITASNAGPNATTATVADTFPAILTATWTCVGAGGGTCTAAGAGNINDAAVTLPAGGSVTYTASATINASATGSLSNTATVTATGGTIDPNAGNNSATDTDTLTPQADLAITKTDGVTTAAPGGSVTYTITASNAGPSNAPGATVADTFPASLTVTWTCVGAGGGTCTAAGAGNINDTVNLPAGGSVTYTASATISASATGTLSNTATVAAPAGVTDPTPGNNSATDSDTLAAQADIAITLVDSPDPVNAGNNITYTVTVSNAGPSDAPADVMDFPLGASTTFVSLTSPAGWTCSTPAVGGTGTVNCTIATLTAGSSAVFTVIVNVNPAATGTVTATATAASSAVDPTPGNNSATAVTTINGTTFVVTGVPVTPAGGSINCVSPVASGATTTCTATANPGFTLTLISGCGGVPSPTSPYTTGPIVAPCTVTATFSGIAAGGPATGIPALQDGVLALLALMLAALGWVGMRRR